MTNTHIHVPERPYWDRDIYGSAMRNGVPVFSKIGRGPKGDKGDQGEAGEDGARGEDGFSPYVTFDTSGENPVMIVTDRYGEHEIELSIDGTFDFDPSSLSQEELFDLAIRMYGGRGYAPIAKMDYCNTLNETPQSGTGNYSNWSKFDATDLQWKSRNGSNSGNIDRNFPTARSSSNGDYYVYPLSMETPLDGYQWSNPTFSRNGLDYAYVSYFNGHPEPATPSFFIRQELVSYENQTEYHDFIYFYPKLDSGHKLEECLLSVTWVPASRYTNFQ